jgi:hypothetical protein
MRRACLVLALLAGVGASKLDHAARNNAFIGYTETKGQPCVVEDRDAQCEQWASSGECTRNPGFMTSTCAKSCGAPCEPEVDDRLTKHANVGAVVFHTAEGDIRVRLRKGRLSHRGRGVLIVRIEAGRVRELLPKRGDARARRDR